MAALWEFENQLFEFENFVWEFEILAVLHAKTALCEFENDVCEFENCPLYGPDHHHWSHEAHQRQKSLNQGRVEMGRNFRSRLGESTANTQGALPWFRAG